MNRRGFFKGLLGVAVAAIAAPLLPDYPIAIVQEIDWIHTFPDDEFARFDISKSGRFPLPQFPLPLYDASAIAEWQANTPFTDRLTRHNGELPKRDGRTLQLYQVTAS